MLKRFFGVSDDVAPAAVISINPDRLATPVIDIKHAIDAHMQWRHRLENYVRGQSFEQFQADAVAADHRCELGQWIHTDGRRKYGHLPQFCELDLIHAEFHRLAGEIVGCTNRNQRAQALELLNASSYSKTAAKLKHLLAKVYVEVLCVENPVRGHAETH